MRVAADPCLDVAGAERFEQRDLVVAHPGLARLDRRDLAAVVVGPAEAVQASQLLQRLGTLEPKTLARTDLEPIFKEKPAVHRFPGTMAQRVQDLARHVVDEYGGDAAQIWKGAKDGDDLKRRLAALPGFGDMKVGTAAAVLAKRFGVKKAESIAPNHPTLGDVDSREALTSYQEAKRAHKASMRSRS